MATDFSASGLRLQVPGPVVSETVCTMHILGYPPEPDLGVTVRSIWTRPTLQSTVHECGVEFLSFDDRSPEAVGRFFQAHPGMSLHIPDVPVRRHPEHGPALMVSSDLDAVRKAHLLRITRGSMAFACRHPVPEGTSVTLTMQFSGLHVRALGTVASCAQMEDSDFHCMEVRLQEKLTLESLRAVMPLLIPDLPAS